MRDELPWGRLRQAAKAASVRIGSRLRDMGLPLPVPARIVYHEDYVSTVYDASSRHTFDSRRPLRIVQELRKAGIVSRRQVLRPDPVGRQDLARIHPDEFLQHIQRPQQLAELLTIPAHVLRMQEAPLQPFLSQAGGTVLALRRAIADGVPVFNLGGGFHHAQRDRAEGFCPINDLAIAIERVRHEGLAQRLMVIDLDYHHGNGTALIYADDEEVFTLSIHGQSWAQVPGKRNHIDLELPSGTGDEDYLQAVADVVPGAIQSFRPDAATYVAGADPFVEDRLGDFRISEDGMLSRDLLVWRSLREAGVPFAVTLAGGYGPFAWTIPYNFIHSVLTGARIPPDRRPSNIASRYGRIKRRISSVDLRRGDGELSQLDIDEQLTTHRRSSLLLGAYTAQGLETALERYGFVQLLRERGFEHLFHSIETEDPDRQVVRVHYDRRDPDHLLIELVLRFRTLRRPESAPFAPDGLKMLSAEWLCMQDPRASFTLDRPQLPGQRYPGMGLGRWIIELLKLMAERLECAGLCAVPERYHNARFYARQLRFFDPAVEGRFQALRRLLDPLPLIDAIAAFDEGRVLEEQSGETIAWEASMQVLPLAAELQAYLESPDYARIVTQTAAAQRLRLIPSTRPIQRQGSPPEPTQL